MKLYFLRHANADWPDWAGSDDERPLTEKGRKQSARVGKFLRRIHVAPEVILTSPLTRAFQTAEIIAHELCIKLKEDPALAKGFDLAALRAVISRARGVDLMIVGHEPDFTAVVQQVTGGRIKLPKAGAARIDLETPESDGRLIWLLPPNAMRRA